MDVSASLVPVLFAAPLAGVACAIAGQYRRLEALKQLGQSATRKGGEVDPQRLERGLLRGLVSLDQLCFTLGVLNVAVTSYIMGAAPQAYIYYFTPKTLILTLLRWWTFKQQGKHFLLLDFCYFANFAVLAYVWGDRGGWFAPETAHRLFNMSFLCANGPLAMAVLQFRHSLVFHSHPHMTSVVIHVSPLLLTYGLRWYGEAFHICEGFPQCGASAGELLWDAFSLFYLWWLGLYYLVVFVFLRGYLDRKGYETLFDRINRDKGFAGRLVRRSPQPRLCYMAIHLCFATATMLLACVLYHSQLLHFAYVLMLCSATVWNGASYYFTVFASRYGTQTSEEARRLAAVTPDVDRADETDLIRKRSPDCDVAEDLEAGASEASTDAPAAPRVVVHPPEEEAEVPPTAPDQLAVTESAVEAAELASPESASLQEAAAAAPAPESAGLPEAAVAVPAPSAEAGGMPTPEAEGLAEAHAEAGAEPAGEPAAEGPAAPPADTAVRRSLTGLNIRDRLFARASEFPAPSAE